MITNRYVVSRLSLKRLAHCVSAYSCLDGILYVGYIDSKSRRRFAIDGEIEIGLAGVALNSQVLDSGDVLHRGYHFVTLLLENVQVGTVNLDRESAFCAADGFIHVVFDGLREI